ncbi:MAG: aminotransferase class V-fold PLP-dependent enzyme, partial [Myxococcota bacterium]
MLPTSEIEKIRAMFPVTGKVNYLNHAAVSPIPTAAVDSINAYLEDVRDYGMMHETRWLGEIERIRGRVQAFINAGEGEIAFIKSPLVAMQIVAQGLNMREGEKIIVADAEFPANVYPWISMVPKGVEVNFVGAQGGMINPEDIERAIDSRTRLVATSRNDVEGIAAVCKRKCVNYFVDVTQAAGEMNVDVKAIGADFALIGGYKWLFGPQGVFMFFCRSDIEKRIRYDGVSWCKITHPEEIAYRAGHENDARRFESDQPNFMGIMGLGGS